MILTGIHFPPNLKRSSMPPKLLFTHVCMLTLFACSNAEIGNIKDVNPETVYTNYHVTYVESDSVVLIRAQFTFAGPNGTTLVLNSPAKIELDGDSIQVDSTTEDGAFYEVKKPVTAFNGSHTLIFTGTNGTKYSQPFTFKAVTLANPIPSQVPKEGMALNFTGLQDNDSIHLRVIDTSGASNSIDTMLLVTRNKALVGNAILQRLHPGRLIFQLGREENLPMANTTKEGGVITILQILGDRQTTLR